MRHLFWILGLLLNAGCVTQGDSPEQTVETIDADDPVATSSTTSTLRPGLLPASAQFELGATVYFFDAVCTNNENLDVVATGSSTADGTGVTFFIQASDVEPYVAIEFTDGSEVTTFEPAVDQLLDIDVFGTEIQLGETSFVQDLDLSTGEGSNPQMGSLRVSCGDFSTN